MSVTKIQPCYHVVRELDVIKDFRAMVRIASILVMCKVDAKL